jgi:hypothetical protein
MDTIVETIDELLTLLASSFVRAPNQRRVFQIAVDELLAPLIALSAHASSSDLVRLAVHSSLLSRSVRPSPFPSVVSNQRLNDYAPAFASLHDFAV